jgi:hypothetical protein
VEEQQLQQLLNADSIRLTQFGEGGGVLVIHISSKLLRYEVLCPKDLSAQVQELEVIHRLIRTQLLPLTLGEAALPVQQPFQTEEEQPVLVVHTSPEFSDFVEQFPVVLSAAGILRLFV